MPDYREIDVSLLVPPERPMRSESLYEGLDELKESMALHGLQQTIGVHALEDGTYRIIWGMRRSLAARELGWKTIPARIYAESEGDADMLMAHENFHRTQLDPVEEAEFFSEMMKKHNVSPAEVARRCRRSVTHVKSLLDLLEGDPEILRALRDQHINKAQASELNKVKDAIGRKQGLYYAKENGLAALYIRRWREDREKSGVSDSAIDVGNALEPMPGASMKTQIRCDICNEWRDLEVIHIKQICDPCFGTIALISDHYAHCVIAQREGGAEHVENNP